MSFVSVENREALIDFLDSIIEYLPEPERQEAFELVHGKKADGAPSDEEFFQYVKRQAMLSWPARKAVKEYSQAEGGEAEWRLLFESVRPETGFLLKRLRERLGSRVLSELLAHEDAAQALQGETRLEVELLRAEILIELWQAQAAELQVHVAQAKKELEARHQRLQKLEQYGSETTRKDRTSELQKQIQGFEHRMYFEGEVIPLEELDQVLQITIGEVLERE